MLISRPPETCTVCFESHVKSAIETIDRITKEQFTFLECPSCHSATLDVSDHFDPSPYYTGWSSETSGYRFKGIVELLVERFRTLRVKFVRRFVGTPAPRLLDIGCGRGLMLRDLAEMGWDCSGTEMFGDAKRDLSRSLLDIKLGSRLEGFNFEDNYFDVITMWHVFEHISNPSELLYEIKRILKPEGILIIEVPNFASWQARLNKSSWIYLEAPRHISQFTPIGIKRLATHFSFEKVYYSTLSFEFGFFGMFQSLLNVLLPVKNLLFSIMNAEERNNLRYRDLKLVFSFVAFALYAAPVLCLSLVLESVSILKGQGSVIRLVLVNLK